ncbi:hypothetical protein GCM10020001_099450 [Nonomuraea salmonea]
MSHIVGGVTVVPAPCLTWTRPFSWRIFTASRTTVRLTENVSHSTGSGGSGEPGGWTPRTMRSTSSAVTALARLAGRRTQLGGPVGGPVGGTETLPGDSCDAVMSSSALRCRRGGAPPV